MKIVRNVILGVSFLLVMLSITSGCAARTVYVVRRPPVARVEVIPARPHARAVWVTGHWRWNQGKYVWVKGRWKKARRGYAWVPSRWVKRPRGWVWKRGHWKKI